MASVVAPSASGTTAAREVEIPIRQFAKTIAIAWTGAFLEWLDFYVFVAMAPVINSVFFPSRDPIASLLATYAALLVGFLFRPLGALLFGWIGDIYGRKRAFVLAALMMLAGTLGIGLLPTYAQVGILVSVLVFILRIIQGLALGGGYGAVIVYLGESIPERRRGLYTGVLFTTPAVGLAVAYGMLSIVERVFGTEALNAWAWRIPFIVAGVVVLSIALMMQLFYEETPVFKTLRTIRRVSTAPVRELFRSREYLTLVLIAWLGVVGAHGPVWYTNQAVSSYYMQYHGVSTGTASWILTTATLASIWTYLLFGHLSDIIGRRKVLLVGIYGNALWFIVAFWYLREAALAKDVTMMFLITLSLTLFNGVGYSGAMSAYLLELFPSRIRLTATALSYNLGYGITGGATPFMTTLFYVVFKDWYLSVIVWSTIAPIILGLIFVLKGRETLGTRLWTEFTADKFMRETIVVKAQEPIRNVIRMVVLKDTRSAAVVYGSDVGIAYRRLLEGAVAKGLEAPVGEVAVKVKCVDPSEPIPHVLQVMESMKGEKKMVPVCKGGNVVGVVDERSLLGEIIGLKSLSRKPIAVKVKLGDVGKKPIVITSDKTVGDAIRMMLQYNIGFLPVVDSQNRLVAVFSERDALKAISNGASLESPLIEYATKDPKVLFCDDPVSKAMELALKYNIRHIVGVDSRGVVACVASVRDLLTVG